MEHTRYAAAARPATASSARRMLALAAAILITGCATQAPVRTVPSMPGAPPPVATAPAPVVDPAQLDALRSLVALQDRLYRVGAPLLVNNTELCKGNARNLLGFTAKNKYSYSSEFIDAASVGLGLNDRLEVMNVLPGSGAAKSGVLRGDIIAAAEDKPLPDGQNAERQAATMLAPLVTGKASVKLTLVRGGANLGVNVPLTHACAFGIELGHADHVNAYADGYRVMLTRGMINFTRNDEELAYVLAKEMAHNALAHAQRQRMNATIGGIIDNLVRIRPDLGTLSGAAGIKPMPANLDAAADTLALYMTARAGYSVDRASAFWQRLAAQYPASVPNGYNAIHTPIDKRLPVIDKTVATIKSKQAKGQPLLP